jgi:hypothetical protein
MEEICVEPELTCFQVRDAECPGRIESGIPLDEFSWL